MIVNRLLLTARVMSIFARYARQGGKPPWIPQA